jgi:hypothetical protein
MYNPIDVRKELKGTIPSFMNLLDGNQISWKQVNKVLYNDFQKRFKELKESGAPITINSSFYDIIINNKKNSDHQISYYNHLFHKLNQLLDERGKKMTSSILKKILMSPNHEHLNFIGELSVLKFALDQGYFDLKKVEERISTNTNKSADFLFYNNRINDNLLIEVVNIHLWKKKYHSIEEMIRNIDSKIQKKVEDTLINEDRRIGIHPVIWVNDLNLLPILGQHYKERAHLPKNVSPPMCWWYSLDKQGTYEHFFETVATTAMRKRA